MTKPNRWHGIVAGSWLDAMHTARSVVDWGWTGTHFINSDGDQVCYVRDLFRLQGLARDQATVYLGHCWKENPAFAGLRDFALLRGIELVELDGP